MKRRVMVVDDEKNMRWVLSEALTKEGYEVVEAGNGKEALASVHPYLVEIGTIVKGSLEALKAEPILVGQANVGD